MATVLHWLAGAKTADSVNDAGPCTEPPETPAPVFAVKAFRHALFGTPQTTQRPQPRRHSTVENRPRNVESPRPTRPRMERPKSASDANALMPPPASPTKGILMTPGTAAAKKKNVTFGDHVVDNQEKRPLKSGLPDDCPGKFPSPWNKGVEPEKDGPTDKGRGRNKLTEALEQARDESRQRRAKAAPGEDDGIEARIPADENDCCAYWRREYEAYRTNTQREVKKLVKKYKAAKDYAQSKDDEASDLRLHLQEAETKADALEEAVNLLTAQIKEMEEALRAKPQSQAEPETLVPAPKQQAVREGPRDLLALLERRGSKERTVSSTTARTTENDQLQRPSEPRPTSSRRTPDTDQLQRPSDSAAAVDRRKEVPSRQNRSTDVVAAARENVQPATSGRTPAGIAARWAAVKDAPQRPNEPASAPSASREPVAVEPRKQPDSVAKPPADRATISTRPPIVAREPAPALATGSLTPPPGDLHVPSEPAVYSPPAASTHTNPHPPPPPKHQATVEDDAPSPPPAPPAHAGGTVPERARMQRQDSGLGGTLKPMSANARSGSAGGAGTADGDVKGAIADGTGGPKIGRDGKAIDPARIEAAKARLRSRGRDVS